MKQKNYANDEFLIVLKTSNDADWQTDIENITTPLTITFAISSVTPLLPKPIIKKLIWDFGTGNQCKSITNRKQSLFAFEVDCKYKKSNNSTIMIQASVFTDDGIFVPKPISTVTSNQLIKAHYVEPEEFKNQILKYYKTNDFTNEVADSIYKIANRLAFAPNFINYTYREEMVGDAIERMVQALTTQKFDPLKGNPFSYFTKIAFHAFCNRIKKEKKSRDALTNYQNEVYSGLSGEGMMQYNRPDHTQEYDSSYYHED